MRVLTQRGITQQPEHGYRNAMTTAIGKIIKKRRDDLGLNRGDLLARLRQRGVDIPRTTLRGWEVDTARKWEYDWNPDFLRALAEALEMSDVELLYEMGFPVIPEGLTHRDAVRVDGFSRAPVGHGEAGAAVLAQVGVYFDRPIDL